MNVRLQQHREKKNGFALLLAIIVSSVVLAIGVSILGISMNQLALSSTARESEIAFQAANAGVECQEYWRDQKASIYTDIRQSTPNPLISCFGVASSPSTKITKYSDPSTGYVYEFDNQFNWGSPARCTKTQLYIFDAISPTTDISQSFVNTAIGNNGVKTCKGGSTCTVLVSDGFNRACNDLTTGVFAIQRELTVEF